jgi:hypothetical protein
MRAKPPAVSVTPVNSEIELRRHTDADGDVLTDEGVAAALEIGARLRGGYQLAVSTGAQRATHTLADDARALVVGHSPTNEAAVLGLTGEIVALLAKGAGVGVLARDDSFKVELLE